MHVGRDRWIQVHYSDATRGEVGLVEYFRDAHLIAEVAAPHPAGAAAFRRMAYTIAAELVAGNDRDELLDTNQGFDPAAVEQYFADGHWRLDDPDRPFLQDPRLVADCSGPVLAAKIAFGRPSGNNPVWGGPHPDHPLSATEALWHLLGQRVYGAGGRMQSRLGLAGGKMPTLRGTIDYHPQAATEFKSLLYGLTTPPAGWTPAPPWRGDLPEVQSDARAAPLEWDWPAGFSQTPHAHLLVFDTDSTTVTGSYVTWGAQPKQILDPADPFVVWTVLAKKSDGTVAPPMPAQAQTGHDLWRDLAALAADTSTTRRPGWLRQNRDWTRSTDVAVRAFCIEQDTGQANDRAWWTSDTPPIATWATPDTFPQIDLAIRAAEVVAGRLNTVMGRAWTGNPKRNLFKPAAARAYWAEAAAEFASHLADPHQMSAHTRFTRLARRTAQDTARPRAGQWPAFIAALDALYPKPKPIKKAADAVSH